MLDWTGEIVGLLHQEKITQKQLAKEIGVSHEWICTLLNQKKPIPDGTEQKMRDAIERIKEKRA